MNITRRQMMGGMAALSIAAALPRHVFAGINNPLTWARNGFFVTPRTQCMEWCKENANDPRASLILKHIGSKPVARWVYDSTSIRDAGQDISEAFARHQLPVIVAYNLPNRDLGSHSRGGEKSTSRYASWAARLAQTIGYCPAIVILEPDALMHATSLGIPEQQEICAQLNAAIQAFAFYAPNAWVYVDAGSGDWPPVEKLIPLFAQLQMNRVRGVSVNVSNYNADEVCIEFVRQLREELEKVNLRVDGWVYDTSRNGTGISKGGEWCNPPKKMLGKTAQININGADACLWVKLPGESDGECGAYPHLKAGEFSPEIAYNLIRGV